MNPKATKLIFKQNAVCIVIPTYNNGRTVADVVRNALEYCEDIIVVDDGSTDNTFVETHGRATLQNDHTSLQNDITIITHPVNMGKGKALTTGFHAALERGFRYAITMDADGQHYASDLPAFAEALTTHPDTLIVGSRQFGLPNMPQKSSFANKFSNFWFAVQTGKRLPDTQTGYRLYPLNKMGKMKLLSSRYEAELALLVRSVWRGIDILPIPINVYYPPKEERVSHFRPGMDFFRISVLNTFFTFAAILYGYPAMLYHHIKNKLKVEN